jgi:ABC-type lipoprotein export system ATPase subunit
MSKHSGQSRQQAEPPAAEENGPAGGVNASTARLSSHDLHKHYRMGDSNLHVLRGATMAIRPGEWVAVLGASGSGKSTLLHLLGGLDRPDQGKVLFDGRDVFAMRGSAIDRYRNRDVGFVFQFYHLLPELTALENVLIGAMISRRTWQWPAERKNLRERATDLLDRVGLKERLRHRPSRLSGGERQRVAIARALINQPAVLLADEPTGNLDAATGGQILNMLARFHAEGQTMVMVTHDAKVAAAADRSIRLESGSIRT